MPTYLYCLVSAAADAASPPAAGLDGAPVRRLDVGGLAAWVSDVGAASVTPTVAAARAHDAVVRAAMERETPLPARFGQTFADDAALRAALAPREEPLVGALERVRGAVEMTVRVLLEDAPAAAPPEAAADAPHGAPSDAPAGRVGGAAAERGRAYLTRLRERRRAEEARQERADFLHDRVAAAVAGVVRGEVRAPLGRDGRALSMSHLVPADAVDRYRDAVRALRQGDPPLRMLISGPWAPYSFATIARE